MAPGTRKRANSIAKNVDGQTNANYTDTRTNTITIGSAMVMVIIIGAKTNTRTSMEPSMIATIRMEIVGAVPRASIMG